MSVPLSFIPDVVLPPQARANLEALGFSSAEHLVNAVSALGPAQQSLLTDYAPGLDLDALQHLAATGALLLELIPPDVLQAFQTALENGLFAMGAQMPAPNTAYTPGVGLPGPGPAGPVKNLASAMRPIRDQGNRSTCVAF